MFSGILQERGYFDLVFVGSCHELVEWSDVSLFLSGFATCLSAMSEVEWSEIEGW